jgi:hypothetical protein
MNLFSKFKKSSSHIPSQSHQLQKDKIINDTLHKQPLENLSQKLNETNTNTNQYQNLEDASIENRQSNAPSDWIDDDVKVKSARKPLDATLESGQRTNWYRRTLLITIGLLIVASTVAGFVWWYDRGGIDLELVQIRVAPPAEVVTGEVLQSTVIIENQNPNPMANAVLVTKYQTGATSPENQRLTRTEVGLIGAGQIKRLEVPLIVLGKLSDPVELDFELEYTGLDSANLFALEFNSEFTIERTKISLQDDFPSELTVGEELPFSLVISTTAEFDEDELIIEFDRAAGLGINLENQTTDDESKIITIPAPTPQQPVQVSGSIQADRTTSGLITVTTTVKDSQGLALVNLKRDISVVLPPILIERNTVTELVIDNEAELEFEVTNTTDSSITGLEVVFDLIGQVNSVKPNRGNFNQVSNQVTFNSSTNSALASLRPGESVELQFSVVPGAGQILNINYAVAGVIAEQATTRRSLAGGTYEYVVKPSAGLDAFATYRQSNFSNRGPLPPKINQETTYTINLDVSLTASGAVADQMVARIPNNVVILNPPQNIQVRGNQLIWNLSTGAQATQFQVALRPERSQLGLAAVLLGDIMFYYSQNQTDKTQAIGPITTELRNDSNFNRSEAIVVE